MVGEISTALDIVDGCRLVHKEFFTVVELLVIIAEIHDCRRATRYRNIIVDIMVVIPSLQFLVMSTCVRDQLQELTPIPFDFV